DGLDVLARAAAIRPSPELRDEAIACLALVDVRVARRWKVPLPIPGNMNFDPQLERYAYPNARGDLSIRRVADHREVRLLPGLGPGARAIWTVFSPDGRYFAAHFANTPRIGAKVLVWDLARAVAAPILQVGPDASERIFTPDSHRVAIARGGREIDIYDLATAGRISRIGMEQPPEQFAFHPQGHQVAVTSLKSRVVQVHDVETGSVVASLSAGGPTRAIAWSGDGRMLAASVEGRRICVWSPPDPTPRAILGDQLPTVIRLAFNRESTLLASGGWDNMTRLWDPVDGRLLVTAPGVFARFGPDGRQLAYNSNAETGIWDMADGREFRTLHHGINPAHPTWKIRTWSTDFSPDGRLLASAGGDGVRLWDPATGRQVAYLAQDDHGFALFDPHGSDLLSFTASGPRRWPVGPDRAGDPGAIRIGPPSPLSIPYYSGDYARAYWNPGRKPLLALSSGSWDTTRVYDPSGVTTPVVLRCPDDLPLQRLALSPNGRWAAGGTWNGSGVFVWDLAAGLPPRLLAGDGSDAIMPFVAFSPDGRWVVTGGMNDFRFYRVGTWEPGRVIPRDSLALPGPMSFRPDGRLLAINHSTGVLRLIEPETGREIATLSAPDP
ncbi:MAG TPA: hypothetical protein VF590_23525, partial [Isosphaeraceae bacterium]